MYWVLAGERLREGYAPPLVQFSILMNQVYLYAVVAGVHHEQTHRSSHRLGYDGKGNMREMSIAVIGCT